MRDFFSLGVMPRNLNRTIIALIPKVNHPERLDQYQPISLCTYAYKIISKVIANRPKPWLPNLISIEQAAFVSDRQIQDNIMIVQEVLHQFKVRKRKRKSMYFLRPICKRRTTELNGISTSFKIICLKWGSIKDGFSW